MVTINDLPELILKRMFMTLYHGCIVNEDNEFTLCSLKRFVHVTAVCKKWREYALPILCSIAVCEHITDELDYFDIENPSTPKEYWMTNIGVIIENQCSKYTKELRLSKRFRYEQNAAGSPDSTTKDNHSTFVDVLERNGFGSVPWVNLHSLDFSALANMLLVGTDSSTDNNHDGMVDYHSYLVRHIPAIKSITACRYYDDDNNDSGIHNLVDNYNNQLTCLKFQHFPPNLALHSLPSSITHLTIFEDSYTIHQLPLMCAQNLKYLFINSFSKSEIWDKFQGPTQKAVVFGDLETLRLHLVDYDGGSVSEEAKLFSVFKASQFPALSNLDVKCMNTNVIKVLEIFPLDKLKTLSITCDPDELKYLDPRLFSSLERFSILETCRTQEFKVDEFVCNMFNTPLDITHLQVAGRMAYDKVMEATLLTNLHMLDIRGVYTWESLSHLVSQLPRLKILTIDPISPPQEIESDEELDDSDISDDIYKASDEIISTSIEELNVITHYLFVTNDPSIIQFAIQIPSLLRISVNLDDYDEFELAIDEQYKNRNVKPDIEINKERIRFLRENNSRPIFDQ